MSLGKAVAWGAALGVVAVIGAGVLFAAYGPGSAASMVDPGDRAMVVLAAHAGQDTGQVAQLIGVLDTSGGQLRATLVDPLTTATVPGTTADRLRDAFSFGGGVGVARAWARGANTSPLPVITLSEQALLEIATRMGGVPVDVPIDAEVFDGSKLYSFRRGKTVLSGSELVALLAAADYAKGADGSAVRAAVASGLAAAFAARDPDISDLVTSGRITSSWKRSDLESFARAVEARLGSLSIAPSR